MKASRSLPPSQIDVMHAFEELAAFEPDKTCWGFFFRDDPPPPATGGGIFGWFATNDELCSFIERFPLMYESNFEPNDEELAGEISKRCDEIRHIVRQYRATESDDPDTLCQRLNTVLANFGQMEWCGTYASLLSSEHSFALELREAFWRDQNLAAEDDVSKPIPANLEQAFAEFAKYYGC